MGLGKKIHSGIKRLGQKTSEGLGYLGKKIKEYKYEILQGLLTTGALGYGLYLSSKHPTYQDLVRGRDNYVLNHPKPLPETRPPPPSYQDALSMEHIAGFRG
jgi:hypothetical protein